LRDLIVTGLRRQREDIMRQLKRSRSTVVLGVAAGLSVLLAGCSSTSSKTSATSMPQASSSAGGPDANYAGGVSAAPATAAAPSAAGPSAAASAPAAAPGHKTTSSTYLKDRKVIFTADITVRAKDVKAAAGTVRQIAEGRGGLVFAEQLNEASKDPENPGVASATMTLKVAPDPATFGEVLDQIGRIGTELGRNQHADDVTAQVVDVDSRVAAANASLARLRTLFDHAGTVGDLASVENEIAQRESDLDSLLSQQRVLSSQTAFATITVNLIAAPTGAVVVAAKKKAHVIGFVRGLRSGWHAFTQAVSGVATAVGALLPFIVLLAVIGIAGVYLRRRLSTGAPPSQPDATPRPEPGS
jgi:hypothetical protein